MGDDGAFDKLNELLLAHQEGRLDETKAHELHSILKNDPEARRRFAELQALECALHLELMAGGTVPRSATPPNVFAAPSAKRTRLWFAAAAFLALATGAALFWIGRSSDKDRPGIQAEKEKEPQLESVAILSGALNPEWVEEGRPATGSELIPGKYSLLKGSVIIDFHSSARIYLEGPSTFHIQSAFSLRLEEGSMRAHVPEPARGFVVATERVKVVDLGTEFSLQTSSINSTVQVFRGEVQLQKPDGTPLPGSSQKLTGGNGLSVDAQGNYRQMEAASPESDTFERIQQRFGAHSQQQFQAWEKRRAEWASRPDLIAYYDFQKKTGMEHQLPDHLATSSGADGVIVGAEWSSGRWEGKTALAFKRSGDRVRINIPGQMDNLTLVAWIRVDSLENRLQGLLLTDGYVEGRPHWQISNDGSLRFGVRLPDLNGKLNSSGYGTPPVFTKERMGVWTFVATVYNRSDKTVRHYVDGTQASQHALVFDQPLTIGPADIGNWGVPFDYKQQPIRNFHGRIDEMIILNAALSKNEVNQLYKSGRQ